MMRKYAVLAPVMFAVVACQDSTSPAPATVMPDRVNAARAAVQNDYIVTFRDDEADPGGQANGLVKAHGGSLRHVYRYALKGFAVANLPDAAVAALQRNPRVARIERDGIVTIDGTQTPTPSWGLDRIDQHNLPLNNSYTYPNDGSGVTAYIIDTGIRFDHVEFGGRATTGYDAVTSGGTAADCNGHGTHVAGTVGGATYGVAKGISLVAVRVLGCSGSGTTAGVIAGIDWVTGHHPAKAVANMSLGGGASATLDDAVTRSINSGVTYAVAAGNDNANACNTSPARTPDALTVGATASNDARASFSNFGSCVDISAPGVGITSSWNTSPTATNTISGTSMATPHVTGAAAVFLSANASTTTPAQVASALINGSTQNVLTGLSGSPNRLLFVVTSGSGSPPPAVDASFTVSCNRFACTFTATTKGASSYAWTFGDGTSGTSNTATTQHSYPQKNSSYPATLTISGTSSTRGISCNPGKGCK
jgi:subtilisin family serine protease